MFQDRIRENYDSLTPGFRKLADFIMNSTLDAAFLTATELSRRVGVDPATVVRFAQELGYSGYRELSREIKHYVRDQVTATYRKVSEAGTIEELLKSLVENAQQNMQHFFTTDMNHVVEAVKMLKGASHIWLTGEFSGYDLAAFMAKKFKTYGVPASVFQPSISETASVLFSMKESDVLFTIAESEPSLDTGYAVQMAHEKGVKTITLTCSGVILPARQSDVTIIVPSKTPIAAPGFGVFTQVLGLIWEAMMREGAPETTERLNQIQENMSTLLKQRSATPDYEVASSSEVAE
ncbi:MAG: MurR/RpiR family transcriptional regulator [Anaerolineae bacterium]|nr:MurR/RpiR family transcriptional regulator [Anaerolineae bacterium]